MISTTVYLSEETREALRDLAEARGWSQNALIRKALESFLEEADNADELNAPDEGEAIENLRAARRIWKDCDVRGRSENRDQEEEE